MSGISQIASTAGSNNGKFFFVRDTDPVIVNNLVANTVTADELNLDGQTITATETAIFLNGTPYGGGSGGGVATVTGTAPITVTGTAADPVVGIDLSGIVRTTGAQTISGGKKFTVLPQSGAGMLPTDPEEFANKAYVDAQVATAEPSAWSQYPATQDVNMNLFKIVQCAEIANNTTGVGLTITSDQDINIEAATGNIDITAQSVILHQSLDVNGYNLTGVGDIIGTTSNMLISTDTDITLQAITGNVEIDAKNLIIKSNAPAGELVSDSTLQIQTDNDMTITATDALSITAGTMTINNALSMTSHKITNVTDPTDPQDAATKAYVDSRPAPPAPTLAAVLTAGNTASADIDMNGNDISSVNDITMSGILPSILATNVAANLTVTSAASMTLSTAGLMTLASGGILSLGGATHTTLENMIIDNSVISKESGEDDLQFQNVASIVPTTGASLQLGASVTITDVGETTIDTQNNTLTLNSGTGDLIVSSGEVVVTGSTVRVGAVGGNTTNIWLNPNSTNNVLVTGTFDEPSYRDSSVLNVADSARGMYIPRLTSTQRLAIPNPQAGLICYDKTDNAIYVYTTSWIKTVLANSANELVTSLSGLESGVPQRQLTGFQSITTGALGVDSISPLDPGIQPYIGIAGDLSLPDNARIDFGAIDRGDGLVRASQALNLQGGGSVGISSDTGAVALTSATTITLNQQTGIILPTGSGVGPGDWGYVITSQGAGSSAQWRPLIGTGTSTGTSPLLIRSDVGTLQEAGVSLDNATGVLF